MVKSNQSVIKKSPVTTIIFILISFIVTLMAPAFDSSVYGFNGHPTEWLSFLPDSPLRNMGVTLFLSPFIHLNLQHLLINMALFIPIALMIERKRSGKFLLGIFFLIQILIIFFLVSINQLHPLSGKAFLGSSHLIMGLYTYWALANKKYGILFFPVLILVVGLWQSQSPLTLLSHFLGALSGLLILFLSSLFRKIRSQTSN